VKRNLCSGAIVTEPSRSKAYSQQGCDDKVITGLTFWPFPMCVQAHATCAMRTYAYGEFSKFQSQITLFFTSLRTATNQREGVTLWVSQPEKPVTGYAPRHMNSGLLNDYSPNSSNHSGNQRPTVSQSRQQRNERAAQRLPPDRNASLAFRMTP
jgi:hypothetical protein